VEDEEGEEVARQNHSRPFILVCWSRDIGTKVAALRTRSKKANKA
jgi:hypothetical protein